MSSSKPTIRLKSYGTPAERAELALRLERACVNVLSPVFAKIKTEPPLLSPREESILDILYEYPHGLTARSIAEELGLNAEYCRAVCTNIYARGGIDKLSAGTGDLIWKVKGVKK